MIASITTGMPFELQLVVFLTYVSLALVNARMFWNACRMKEPMPMIWNLLVCLGGGASTGFAILILLEWTGVL